MFILFATVNKLRKPLRTMQTVNNAAIFNVYKQTLEIQSACVRRLSDSLIGFCPDRNLRLEVRQVCRIYYTSCAGGDTICPAPLPRGRPSASRAAEQTQRSSSFLRPIPFSRSPLHLPHVLRPCWVKRPGDVDLLTLKVVSKSRVTWVTSVPFLVFL